MFIKDEKILSGGDDLGSIWYDFYGMTMEKAMDWVKRRGLDQYEVSIIRTWKKYWWFGPYTRIHIVFDKLEGPPRHTSEFADLLTWVRDHGKGHKLELTTDNHKVTATLYDLDGVRRFELTTTPEEFRRYYNENGHSIYFLKELWNNLHPQKLHTA